jgi:hypothetical protein
MTGDSNPAAPTGAATAGSVRPVAAYWLLLAAIVAAAIALRSLVAANTDVSWLLIVCDKILAGQHLYADIIETNPPIAVWAYMPGTIVAHAFGLRAEMATDVLVFTGAALSALATAIMLRPSAAIRTRSAAPLRLVCAFILLVVPMQAFGQREHIAFIAFLPALAGYILRAERRVLPFWQILAAGIGAGITLAFKPYFVFAAGAAILVAALHARSWRVLFVQENFIAGGLVVIYSLITYACYPAYFTVIFPLVRDVYLPLKRPLGELLTSNGMLTWAAASIVTVLAIRVRRPDAVTSVLLSASIGFAAAYVLQRKGWSYQSYPMLALALIALASELNTSASCVHSASRAGGLACLAALIITTMLWMNDASSARILEQPVRALGPHPRVLALTSEPSIGHPLTRAVGGTWVSRQQGLWVREFVKRLRAEHIVDAKADAALNAYVARERAWLIEDVKRTPPTVILVDNLFSGWGTWAAADSFFADFLKRYRRVETIQHIDILALRDDAQPAAPK